jgi:hypothetical protein
MKNFLILLMILGLSSWISAQNAPITFETGEFGATWSWNVFENNTNPPLEILANPDPNGINTSATVAKFTALQTGQPWAGCESLQGIDLGTFQWNDSNRIVKIMVWKSVISNVGIKFDTETGWSQGEIKVPNTLVNQWEELSFDFSNYINPPAGNGTLGRIVIFPDFNLGGRTQDNVAYFDNITFSAGGAPANEPSGPAPIPPVRDAADVVSIFSGAYTDVGGTDFNPNWGQSTLVAITEIQGNPTLRYANFNYQGTQFSNPIDASGMDKLHLDMWTADATSVNIFCISPGPVETAYSLPITTGKWVSYDIPLSAFANVDMVNLIQFKFDGGNGSQTFYLDNIYFYKEVAPVITVIDFEDGGLGSDFTWTVFENANNPPLEIIANPDTSGINFSAKVAKFTALKDGQPWAGVESAHGDDDLGPFVLSDLNSIVKINVWKSIISDVAIKFDSPTGWSQGELKVANTKVNQWEELTFDFSGFMNPPAGEGQFDRVIVFPDFNLSGRTQDNVIYFDNISFNPKPSTDAPPVPAGLVASNKIGDNPVGSGEMFLACGPNNVGGDIVYRLFYAKTAEAPADPKNAIQYVFGTTPGDGNGNNAFGFVLTGLNPGTQYTFWLYQFNTKSNLYSNGFATASAVSGGQSVNEPQAAAPTPPERLPSNVISIFSGAYTDLPETDFNPNWGQSTQVSVVEIEGNKTLKYASFNYQGTQFKSSVDASAMEKLHLDMWTGNASAVNVFCISPGPVETAYTLPLTPGQWVSYDIPLSAFTNVDMKNLIQFKFDGGNGSPTIFLDNIYFYKESGSSVSGVDENSVKMFPNPVKEGGYVYLNSVAEMVEIFDINGKLLMSSENTSTINVGFMKQGMYLVSLKMNGTKHALKLIIN